MLKILKQMFNSPKRQFNLEDFAHVSDITLTVTFGCPNNNHTVIYKLHRVVLAAASKCFETMIKENGEENILVVENDHKVFEVFLKYIYRCFVYEDLIKLTLKEIEELHNISIKYEIIELSNICKYVLTEDITFENALEYLYIAIKTDNDHKRMSCLNFISIHAVYILKQEKLIDLDIDILKTIIESSSLNITELKVLSILYNYADEIFATIPVCDSDEFLDKTPNKTTFQQIIIRKIYESTNNENFGTLIYRQSKVLVRRKTQIKGFLLSNNLINQVRILTVDLENFIFNTVATIIFDGNEILFICDYLLSPSEDKPEIQNSFICKNIECRDNALNAKRPRRKFLKRNAQIRASIIFSLDLEIISESPNSYTEEFIYASSVPMSIDHFIWGLDMTSIKLQKFVVKINVEDVPLNLTYKNHSEGKLVKSVLSYKGKPYVFKKGTKFSVCIECATCFVRYNFRLIHKSNGYQVIKHCSQTLTCIQEFGVTFYV